MMGYSSRAGRATWTVALIAALLFITYQIRETLFIFVLAVFFSYMVYPLVVYLERHRPRRASRTSSVALTYLLVVIVLVTAFAEIGTQIAAQATRLAQALPALARDPHWIDRVPLPHALDPIKYSLLRRSSRAGCVKPARLGSKASASPTGHTSCRIPEDQKIGRC